MRQFALLFLIAVTGHGFSGAIPAPSRAQDADKLAAIVQKALDYCRRVDRTVFNLICKEEVAEEANRRLPPPGTQISIATPSTLIGDRQSTFRQAREEDPPKTISLYDYRFARKGAEVQENRGFLEKDGENTSATEASPENWHFKFRDILFGPSLLLGEGAAPKYQYLLVEEGKIQGDAVAVVACVARPEYAAKVLWGRASVRLKDGAVLRIDWTPESLASHDEVLDIAKQYRLSPKIQAYTEFGIEKHGIRFPSFDFNEESYVTLEKSKIIRSRTAVKYKAYVFYTVETSSDIKRP